MSKHFHSVVWIDHRQARILNFNAELYDTETIASTHPDQHLHHKANSGDSGHAAPDHEFYRHVDRALADAGAVLVVGPSSAKHEFVKYVKDHDASLAGRISGIETLDHPSDGAIVAFARHFFRADDRMHSQISF